MSESTSSPPEAEDGRATPNVRARLDAYRKAELERLGVERASDSEAPATLQATKAAV